MEAPKIAENEEYLSVLTEIVIRYAPSDPAEKGEFEVLMAALTVLCVRHGQELERYFIHRRNSIGGN